MISIHPSRVGWDLPCTRAATRCQNFNPPIPCGMGRMIRTSPSACWNFNPPIPCGMGRGGETSWTLDDVFQSTHPVWDGTSLDSDKKYLHLYFNPPIPCGMGRAHSPQVCTGITISIHPSRVGWDENCLDAAADELHFNPPIPCGMGQEVGQCQHHRS